MFANANSAIAHLPNPVNAFIIKLNQIIERINEMKMSEANLIKKTEKESQKDLLEILSNDMDHLEKVIELKTICQINQEILTK